MKKLIFLVSFVFLTGIDVFGQEMLGIRPSNYGGLHNVGLNPSFIANSRLNLDINIIGANVTFENDFLYIPKENLKFFGLSNIFKRIDDKDYTDNFKFGDPNKKNHLYSSALIMGPSVMFNIKNEHHFAITTGARHAESIVDGDAHMSKFANEGLGYDPLHGQTFNSNEFEINMVAWFEYGLTYARTFTKSEENSFSGGITLKLLQGVSAGYTKNPDITYNVLNDQDMVFIGTPENPTSLDYGRVSYNVFDDIGGYGDAVNGSGFGMDIGFSYEIRNEPEKWQYMMDGEMRENPEVNKYKWRFGASLIDWGKIKFNENAGVYHVETSDSAFYYNYDEDEFEDNPDWDKSMSYIFYGDSTASFRDDNFDMRLPVGLNLNVDFNAYKNWYVNASYTHGFAQDKPGVDRPSVLSITPRIEKKWFDVSMPFSYYNYTGDQMRLGLAARFASFIIGSDRIGTLFGLSDLNGMDFYVNLKFSIHKEKPSDRDGDQVSDAKDKCPDTPGIWKFEGCPDRDGDDIQDALDLCPDTPGLVEFSGCPDIDGDGIIDRDDDCPDIAGIPEFNGCPDTDGDGIQDAEDRCPTTRGLPEFQGCPDSDGDGIPDPDDDCPTKVGTLANKGCPEAKPIPVIAFTLEDQAIIDKVFENLQFETGKAVIKESSYESLNSLADLMKRKTKFKLKIDGHTDSVGSAASNKTLSQRRADSAKKYLTDKGVDGSRMTTKGYGEEKPVDTNETKAGRAKNRRVEFTVIE
jgi:outer membrane protein OmpA-like peptidoglycan-associated protein